jgi:hypothetical protein
MAQRHITELERAEPLWLRAGARFALGLHAAQTTDPRCFVEEQVYIDTLQKVRTHQPDTGEKLKEPERPAQPAPTPVPLSTPMPAPTNDDGVSP